MVAVDPMWTPWPLVRSRPPAWRSQFLMSSWRKRFHHSSFSTRVHARELLYYAEWKMFGLPQLLLAL